MKLLSSKRTEDKVTMKFKKFKDHEEMANRLTKTLYYGKNPRTERPSLAMTDITVELFTEAVPNVGLDQIDMHYAASVSRNACASPCSLMLALVYIDRLRRTNPDYLKTISSSDIFLISMMIASKFLYDEGEEEEVFNDEWAASANMDTKEINQMEREFLAALDWNVFVDVITLYKVLHHLESHIALKEGVKRGWFSYTDLEILSKNLPGLESMHFLMENVFKVAIACALAYVAGILTILGATIFVHKGIRPETWIAGFTSASTDFHVHHEVPDNNSLDIFRSVFDEEKSDCNFCSSAATLWTHTDEVSSKNAVTLEMNNSFSRFSIASVNAERETFSFSIENPHSFYSFHECICEKQKSLLQRNTILKPKSKCSNLLPVAHFSR